MPHRGAVTEEQAMIAELEEEKSLKDRDAPELLTGSIAEKMKHDQEKLTAVFSHPETTLNVKQLRRLGSTTGKRTGPRSILVTCNDVFTRNFVLRAASALRTFPENGVFISLCYHRPTQNLNKICSKKTP